RDRRTTEKNTSGGAGGGPVNGRSDAPVSPTATNVPGHCGVDLDVGRSGVSRKQRHGRHYLPGLAIAALRHVLSNPGPLDRVAAVRREAFDRRKRLRPDRGDRYGT